MRDLEQEILARLNAALSEFSAALLEAGLSAGTPQVEAWNERDDAYTSEIRVTILRDGQIDDVLEFHIFRNGLAVVTADEASDWYRIELARLCQSA